MLSYNHIGINTMNHDHQMRLSSLRTSKIKKIKQMNQLHKARCSTAILLIDDFYATKVKFAKLAMSFLVRNF